ncbi:DUF6216 family protein [Variovorax sp. MHTC-1]|uniref:DUF6216 family protein n=1 Tax=Variovorax sp. MHTC-1 TaxID=2495593 RepID=UPI000F864BBD|nr:DUF6216 family protein [Variovorax sp. MHTC-1]RST56158.1 hypothetical protein EJI01_05220 [Variovorax sp. MHTC-1]
MDSTTLSAIPGVFSIAAPVLLALAFIWVVRRTESFHVPVRRLWQLVHGNQEIADPDVRSFVDEQTSLVSFRMFAGVPAASLDEAHRLIQWTKLNGVQMRTVRLCGEYFDAGTCQIRVHKLPGRPRQIARLIGFVIAVVMGAVSAASLLSDRPLLSLKATSKTFFGTATEAQAAWPLWPLDPAPLRLADCSKSESENAARTTFTGPEVNVLCDIFKAEDTSAFMKEALMKQRWNLAQFALVVAWISWLLLVALARATAARSLARRSVGPSLGGHQLSFDWHK